MVECGRIRMMTVGYGIGMFAYNMVCLLVGLMIVYYFIRNIK